MRLDDNGVQAKVSSVLALVLSQDGDRRITHDFHPPATILETRGILCDYVGHSRSDDGNLGPETVGSDSVALEFARETEHLQRHRCLGSPVHRTSVEVIGANVQKRGHVEDSGIATLGSALDEVGYGVFGYKERPAELFGENIRQE